MIKTTKKVLWVFSTQLKIPSDIVGCSMPAEFLDMPSIVLGSSDNIVNILDKFKPDIIVFGKCFHKNVINLAIESRNRGVKTVSSFNDWHFKPENLKQ